MIEAATGCRDESAARQVLADLERRSERVRSGLITSAESRIVKHLTTPIGEHVDAFIASIESSDATAKHVRETRRVLNAVLKGCGFASLADLESVRSRTVVNQAKGRRGIGQNPKCRPHRPHVLRQLVRDQSAADHEPVPRDA